MWRDHNSWSLAWTQGWNLGHCNVDRDRKLPTKDARHELTWHASHGLEFLFHCCRWCLIHVSRYGDLGTVSRLTFRTRISTPSLDQTTNNHRLTFLYQKLYTVDEQGDVHLIMRSPRVSSGRFPSGVPSVEYRRYLLFKTQVW